jgi:hypothetical protein
MAARSRRIREFLLPGRQIRLGGGGHASERRYWAGWRSAEYNGWMRRAEWAAEF